MLFRSGVKILMMGISSIPMLLTLILGLSLRSFTQWQKICGIIFISTAIYFAFAFLSIVCMLYTPDLKSVVDQKALALFSDIASGAAFFSLVLLSGIVLLYKGNSTKTSSIYFKTGNSQTFSNSDATRDKENLQQKISDPDYNFSRNSPSNNPGQTKDPMVMQLAFSKEKMAGYLEMYIHMNIHTCTYMYVDIRILEYFQNIKNKKLII